MEKENGSTAAQNQSAGKNTKVTALMVFIAVSCVLGYALAGGISNMITPAMSSLLQFFGQDKMWGASLASIMAFVDMVFIVPIGVLAVKYGLKIMGVIGLGLMGIGALLSAFTASAEIFVALRFVEALGYTFMFCVSKSLIAEWFPVEKRGIPLGFCSAGIGIGTIITLNSANLVMPAFGWQGLWILMAIFCFIIMACFIFGVKNNPAGMAERKAAEAKKVKAPWGEIFRMPMVWGFAAIFCLWGIAQKGYAPFSSMLYVDQAGLDPAIANTISSLSPFGQIIGALITGVVFSKMKRNRGLFFCASIVVSFFTWFMVFGVDNVPAAIFFAFGCGFFGIFVAAGCTMFVPEFSSKQMYIPLAISIMTAGMSLGGIVGPYVVAWFQEAFGTWSSCRYLMLILGALCLIIAIIAWRADIKRYWSDGDTKTPYAVVEERLEAKRSHN